MGLTTPPCQNLLTIETTAVTPNVIQLRPYMPTEQSMGIIYIFIEMLKYDRRVHFVLNTRVMHYLLTGEEIFKHVYIIQF